MSPRPITRAKLRGEEVHHTCGRLAVENMERAFWQSRADLLEAPAIVNLPELAREIRATYPQGIERLQEHILAPILTRGLRILATNRNLTP